MAPGTGPAWPEVLVLRGLGEQLPVQVAGRLVGAEGVGLGADLAGDRAEARVGGGHPAAEGGVVAALLEEGPVVVQGSLQQLLAQRLQALLAQQQVLADRREVVVDHVVGAEETALGVVALGAGFGRLAVGRPGREAQATAVPATSNRNASQISPATTGVAPAPARQPAGRPDRPRLNRPAVQEAAEVVGQRGGAGVAPVRRLLQALQADRLQVARHPGLQLPRGHRLVVEHLDAASRSRVSARNGGRPVRHSYSTAPRPYTSAAGPTACPSRRRPVRGPCNWACRRPPAGVYGPVQSPGEAEVASGPRTHEVSTNLMQSGRPIGSGVTLGSSCFSSVVASCILVPRAGCWRA